MTKEKFKDKWNFDKWAATYDKAVDKDDWMYKDYDIILQKVVKYANITSPDLTLVDIGTGTGNLASQFIQFGIKIIGVDPSEEMRKMAQKKFPQISVYKGHFLDLPFENQRVDIIVSSYAFHHLTDYEKENSIQEMKRVLKQGGKIIIADLMFKNKEIEKRIKEKLLKNGKKWIVEEIDDEFFGLFDELQKKFAKNDFLFEGEQITDFVWIFRATLKK